jgi:outer membrane murein-binding lipoprotein Lpp
MSSRVDEIEKLIESNTGPKFGYTHQLVEAIRYLLSQLKDGGAEDQAFEPPVSANGKCFLCEKGFPVQNGVHYGTQSLGMIPSTLCATAPTESSERCGERAEPIDAESQYQVDAIRARRFNNFRGTAEEWVAFEYGSVALGGAATELAGERDTESRAIAAKMAQLVDRFEKATTHDELVALVWACRVLIDADAEAAPFFTPEAVDRQVVYTSALRLYFDHAQRILGRSPSPAEVDEIETGFCESRLEVLKAERMAKGQQLLASLTAATPVVAQPEADPRHTDLDWAKWEAEAIKFCDAECYAAHPSKTPTEWDILALLQERNRLLATTSPSTTAQEATQTWCDHCSADLNGVRHILCERCYREYAGPKWFDPAFNAPPSDAATRAAREIGEWLRTGDGEVDGNAIKEVAAIISKHCGGREAVEWQGCPCLFTKPCNKRCTCVNKHSSVGCARCCTYGSPEQQKAAAERIVAEVSRLSSEVENLKADLVDAREAADSARVERDAARANAIGECVSATQSVLKPVGSALEHHARRTFNDGVQAALAALEQPKREGGRDATRTTQSD